MAASSSDYFMKVGRATATTLSAPGYTTGSTSINVASTTNWPTDTGVTFAIDEVDGDGVRISGTYNVFHGVVSGATQLTGVTYAGGDANRDYSAGATTRVYILVSAYRDNKFTDGVLVEHKQDGKHGDITADSLTMNSGASVDFSESKLASTDISDTGVKPRNLNSSVILSKDGSDVNPVPTSTTDVASSSLTFTLDTNSTLLITWGARIQSNNSQTTNIFLNIGGVDETEPVKQQQQTGSGVQNHHSLSRTITKDLAAGEHTIKLRAVCSQSSASVIYAPYWRAVVVSQ